MDTQLTASDIKNLLAIINLAPIKGSEAMTVAVLQQKLNNMLTQPGAEIIGKGTETENDTPQEPAPKTD